MYHHEQACAQEFVRGARGRADSEVASAERLTGSWHIGRRELIWLSASYVHSFTNLIVLSLMNSNGLLLKNAAMYSQILLDCRRPA